jgi:hypothetical protein
MSWITDRHGYSISVAADAEEESLDINSREFVFMTNNTPTSTTTRKRALMKTSTTTKSTASCPEILLLWMLRMVAVMCMTFRDWREL